MKDPTPIYLGIDPDLHTTAVVAIRNDDIYVQVLRVPAAEVEKQAAMSMIREIAKFFADPTWYLARVVVGIEAQELAYSAKNKVNPRDILHLGWVSGALLGIFYTYAPVINLEQVYFWRPSEWKGQRPKKVHQALMYEKLDVPYRIAGGKDPYCIPDSSFTDDLVKMGKVNDGDWKHLGDALGLALKAREVHAQRK